MTEPQIRLARESDKEPILAFCQILPNNQKDYIPLVWDKWIRDPSGCIFVVTIDDVPVAMERVVLMSDSEAWWEGLRVSPQYRGQGLSKILEFTINQYLVESGINISRCMILASNEIMADIMSKRGRKKVGNFDFYETDSINSPSTQLIKLNSNDLDYICSLVKNSNDLTLRQEIYVSYGGKWQEITVKELKKCLSLGKIWGLKKDDKLLSIAIESYSENSNEKFWIGYVNGTKNSLPTLLYELRKLAHSLGYTLVGGFFPCSEVLSVSFDLANYIKINQRWVYEWKNS